jgi:hypothetical protein
MRDKLLAIKIMAALGIPLFPLGARFFPPRSNASDFREASPGVWETPAAALEPERPVEAGAPFEEPLPPPGAETLARVFRIPKGAAAGENPPGDEGISQTRPVPGDGKFSYLGSIRESNNQEWLYIKEEETGRIISVNASPGSINAEDCVVEIEGTSYFIRRK